MNELLFLLHLAIMLSFGWGALKLGREALVSWVAIQATLANLFVIKQVNFLGLSVTCSDVYAIGSILGLNLLQEYFGKESARRAVWTCFFLMIFFVLMSTLHLLYTPNREDQSQEAFMTILQYTPRLLGASLATFLIVQQWDLHFFGYLKKQLPRASLAVRNSLSLVLSQLLDTALFSLLGLWGIVSCLGQIFLFSFCIKLLMISLMMPTLQLFKRRAHE